MNINYLYFRLLIGMLLLSHFNTQAQSSDLIIKQIYYAGSDTKTASSIRDQFVELYNNSDQTIYADGLCLSLVAGSRQFPGADSTMDQRGKRYYRQFSYLKNGAYDWQKSYGMPANIKANEDYIYLTNIYQIPGNGRDYPVEPGKSLLIAQSAKNYTATNKNYLMNDYTPTRPELTVDLRKADFEANHIVLYKNPADASDEDNPDVPDLLIQKASNHIDFIMDSYGKGALVLFRYTQSFDSLPVYNAPTADGTKTTNAAYLAYPFYQLPLHYVLDAVETQPSLDPRSPKRLPTSLDKGYAVTEGGEYSSNSILRKTAKVIHGRVILQDTNNSSQDFVTIKAQPNAFQITER